MDERLLHFGMMENARTINNWSSWGVEDAMTLHLLCFLFLWYFVVCKWKCCFFFHGCDDVRRWSKKYFKIVLELVGYGVWVFQYLKGAFTEEKLSFYVWVVWRVQIIIFCGFWMLVTCVVCISWLAMTLNKKECEGNALITW